jgi:Cu2+-exporting ATPase
MARMDDLVAFAHMHNLKMGTIRDLIAYRRKHDHLVEKRAEMKFNSRWGGDWSAMTFYNKATGDETMALVKGRIDPEKPTLVRMHTMSMFVDVFGEESDEVPRQLALALGARGQRLLETCGLREVREFPGSGVRCSAEDGEWFLGKGEGGTELRHGDQVAASFVFRDALRPGAVEAIRQLARRGLSAHILSGDAPEKVARLAAALGLPPENAVGGLSPDDKAARVAALDRQDTLYLGDGANDSLAFDAAFVTGTPVVDRSLLESKSDFYALGSGLAYLAEAFAAADARARGVRRAFVFALSYNLAVVALSASAHMNPLLAAILMPLSSVVSILLVASGGRTPWVDLSRRTPYAAAASPRKPRIPHEPGEQAIRSNPA